MAAAPRPRLIDHLRVTGLLVVTLLGLIPIAVWVVLSPVLKPLTRARLKRRLESDAGPPAEPPVPDASAWAGKTVFVVAGEASGDRLAAPVVRAMLGHCPALRVRGYAGPETAAAGAVLDRNLVDHAVIGVTAVVKSIGFWWGVCAETLARLREDPPDLFLTVDFPGLNVRLARWARKSGISTVHLVAPAVWAYAPWRMIRWRLAIDRLLTVFPHEAILFRGSGIPSSFVGHSTFEAPLAAPRTSSTWPGGGRCRVEVLPGSRRQELTLNAPVALDACVRVADRMPDAQFVVRLARPEHRALFEAAAEDAPRRPERLEVRVGEGPGKSTDAPLLGALAKSGTVTSELGASCVPMAVYYRLTWPLRFGAWVGLTSPFIALANLVAGRRVVPEFLQSTGSGRRLADDFLRFATDPERWQRVRADLEKDVRHRLEVADVADRTARAVLDLGVHSDASARAVGVSPPTRPTGGPS